jgi:hypothetical protein
MWDALCRVRISAFTTGGYTHTCILAGGGHVIYAKCAACKKEVPVFFRTFSLDSEPDGSILYIIL